MKAAANLNPAAACSFAIRLAQLHWRLRIFSAKLHCGMEPTGNCYRVLLGMGQAGRDLASDLMRRDGSNIFALAASKVSRLTLAGFLIETAPAKGGSAEAANAPGETAPALRSNVSGCPPVPSRRFGNSSRSPGIKRHGQAVGGAYCHGDSA